MIRTLLKFMAVIFLLALVTSFGFKFLLALITIALSIAIIAAIAYIIIKCWQIIFLVLFAMFVFAILL